MKRILLTAITLLGLHLAKAQDTDPVYHVTEAQFKATLAVTDEFTHSIYELLKTPSVKQEVDAAYKEDATTGRKFKALYARDLCRCMREMGVDTDFLNNPEGNVLIVQFFHDDNGQPNDVRLTHADLTRTRTYLKKETEWIGTLNSRIDVLNPDKSLCVANLLDNAERGDLCKPYYLALHKFCSHVANQDKKVTAQETAWLNKLKALAERPANKPTASKSKATNAKNSKSNTTAAKNPEDDPFVRLDNLIGLDEVKEKVRTLANTVKIQKMKEARGLKTQPMSYHCVFLGNPGTGKTTVARILADIYRDLGVVKKGHLVETDRSGLIASYVGQTAPKVNHMCDSALNGILFIDEAYAITQGGQSDYGNEAVATLLKRMEDDRDKLVVILAGYSKEMNDFLEANSGIKSRINNYINFPDYTSSELFEIFLSNIKKNDCSLAKNAESVVKNHITNTVAHKDAYFGNGRFVRNFVEKVLEEQANRLSTISDNITDKMLRTLEKEDVENAIQAMKNNK